MVVAGRSLGSASRARVINACASPFLCATATAFSRPRRAAAAAYGVDPTYATSRSPASSLAVDRPPLGCR